MVNSTSNSKLVTYSILSVLLLFLITLGFLGRYWNSTETDTELTLYKIGQLKDVSGVKAKSITKEEALQLDEKSIILVDQSEIKETPDVFYQYILNEHQHLIMFIGINLDMEAGLYQFNQDTFRAIELDGSSKVYYHGVGAMYSDELQDYIPIYYGSTNSTKINSDDLRQFILQLTKE